MVPFALFRLNLLIFWALWGAACEYLRRQIWNRREWSWEGVSSQARFAYGRFWVQSLPRSSPGPTNLRATAPLGGSQTGFTPFGSGSARTKIRFGAVWK